MTPTSATSMIAVNSLTRRNRTATLTTTFFGPRMAMLGAMTMLAVMLLSCCTTFGEATPLPTMRQQQYDLDRYLLALAASMPSEKDASRYSADIIGSGGDLLDDDGWSATPVKKNYQHIWRNVQMRMPHYRNNDVQTAESKRSSVSTANEVLRHRANSLYRLGK